MAASRFPGKPLHPILGRPMIEHCYRRAALYPNWDHLSLATCDRKIEEFAESVDINCVMTGDHHVRALDRVAEGATKVEANISSDDIVVCVQGDEPLLGPDMIEAVLQPLLEESDIEGTMKAAPNMEETTFLNPDIVKLVHDIYGNIIYTSRSPIPYGKKFSPELGAKRVGGIFGFRWQFLKWFTETPESPLEILESCDSNRIIDNGRKQRMATAPERPYISVDSPSDIALAEAAMSLDPLLGQY